MEPLQGTIAPTDYDWYSFLQTRPPLDEVNFWKPSADRAFRGQPFTPFFFKLKAPHRAICGFGFFVRYASLPDWMAWECFGEGNGCRSFEEMRRRIADIRERMKYRPTKNIGEIGCIVITQPTFFAREDWIRQPHDWPDRSLTPVRGLTIAEAGPRHGAPRLVRPRLGQGAFRVVVTDAYERACAVTQEHSLPALEAAHIRPFAQDGQHEVVNGILLRADLHRLFDHGYIAVDAGLRLCIGDRLRADFANGRSYYPLHGRELRLPPLSADRPDPDLLAWHREHVFLG